MIRAEHSSLPELCVLPRSCSKNTPGERCSWETIVALGAIDGADEPVVVMSGIPPMYTSCSSTSFGTGLGASLSMITRRTLARSGLASGRPTLLASLTSNRGSPSWKLTNSAARFPMRRDREDRRERRLQAPRSCAFGATCACRRRLSVSSCVASGAGLLRRRTLGEVLRMRLRSVQPSGSSNAPKSLAAKGSVPTIRTAEGVCQTQLPRSSKFHVLDRFRASVRRFFAIASARPSRCLPSRAWVAIRQVLAYFQAQAGPASRTPWSRLPLSPIAVRTTRELRLFLGLATPARLPPGPPPRLRLGRTPNFSSMSLMSCEARGRSDSVLLPESVLVPCSSPDSKVPDS